MFEYFVNVFIYKFRYYKLVPKFIVLDLYMLIYRSNTINLGIFEMIFKHL